MKVKNNIKIKIIRGAEISASALVSGKTTTTSLINLLSSPFHRPGTGKSTLVKDFLPFIDIEFESSSSSSQSNPPPDRELGITIRLNLWYDPRLIESSQLPNTQPQLILGPLSSGPCPQAYSDSPEKTKPEDYVLVEKDNAEDQNQQSKDTNQCRIM